MKTFNVGDRVKYTNAFCRAFRVTPEVANLKGTVQGVKKFANARPLVTILWDGDTETKSAIPLYLTRVK